MNIQTRKLNLIKNLIYFQDDKLLDKIEIFFASLMTKEKVSKPIKKANLASYKKNILSVSTWSNKDISALEENLKSINAWKIEKW